MSIAIDSSTPASVTVTTALSGTTATFSPPANSLLVIGSGNAEPFAVSSVSDNLGTHLTYSQLVSKTSVFTDTIAEIWCAYTTSAQTNMTVTVTYANASTIAVFFVAVLTGAASTQTGATGTGTNQNTTPAASVTTTANGSQVIGVCATRGGAPTPNGGQTNTFGSRTFAGPVSGDYQWMQTTTAPTSLSGTNVTIGDTITSAEWAYAVAEILAATGGGGNPAIAPQIISGHSTYF